MHITAGPGKAVVHCYCPFTGMENRVEITLFFVPVQSLLYISNLSCLSHI